MCLQIPFYERSADLKISKSPRETQGAKENFTCLC